MNQRDADDQFNAMLATMPDYRPRMANDLYCGHRDAQGLSWTREYCPICAPKEQP